MADIDDIMAQPSTVDVVGNMAHAPVWGGLKQYLPEQPDWMKILQQYTGKGIAGGAQALQDNLPPGVFDAMSLVMPGSKIRIPNPIKAYHGSPHDFDAFDLSKVGTGEGAQAYGHGLYFAEHEPVARSYREGLSKWKPEIDGKPIIEMAANGELQRVLAAKADLSRPDAITAAGLVGQSLREGRPIGEIIAAKVARAKEIYPSDMAASEIASLAKLQSKLEPIIPTADKGSMYEVALHSKDFLDWDRPLSGQSALVRAAIERIAGPEYARSQRLTGAQLAPTIPGGGGLAEAGIPGLKYLDQGSRSAGHGTSNYVVWSPEIIEILRKYGIAAPVAGPSLAGVLSQYGGGDAD